jgi:hypothetical protein
MGALYIKPLDDRMKETGVFYARFMDDWVIIAQTRWKLRFVIRNVNKILNSLKLKKHPDKTFIGKVSRVLILWIKCVIPVKTGFYRARPETMKGAESRSEFRSLKYMPPGATWWIPAFAGMTIK